VSRSLIQICTLLAVLLLPAVGRAQFNFSTNNGAITITAYTGSNNMVVIPSMTNGYPVTSIGDSAFLYSTLTQVTIPNSVTNIGYGTFYECALTSVTIPNSVTSLGTNAFGNCYGLTSVTIPSEVTVLNDSVFSECIGLTNITISDGVADIGSNAFGDCRALLKLVIPGSVTNIGDAAFNDCTALTNVTMLDGVRNIARNVFTLCFSLSSVIIPGTVTNIGNFAFSSTGLINVTIPGSVILLGDGAFNNCLNLTGVFFAGDAPATYETFYYSSNVTVYYLPGTTGWGPTFGSGIYLAGAPTVLWNPQAQTGDGSFGVLNNQFGFNITGSSNLVIVVEANTNLASPTWIPVGTNTLNTFIGTNGSSYFSDPQWTNYPGRFYRFRSP
jgi:hypothetical protein